MALLPAGMEVCISGCHGSTVSRRLIPRRKGKPYQENIWDHAAGTLVVEEAGGTVALLGECTINQQVTDVNGLPLDFSLGAKLSGNVGVVASNGPLHARIIEVCRARASDRKAVQAALA